MGYCSIVALHPSRDLIGRRQSQEDEDASTMADSSPSSSLCLEQSSCASVLSEYAQSTLGYLMDMRNIDVEQRRIAAEEYGMTPSTSEEFYGGVCVDIVID